MTSHSLTFVCIDRSIMKLIISETLKSGFGVSSLRSVTCSLETRGFFEHSLRVESFSQAHISGQFSYFRRQTTVNVCWCPWCFTKGFSPKTGPEASLGGDRLTEVENSSPRLSVSRTCSQWRCLERTWQCLRDVMGCKSVNLFLCLLQG